MKTIPFGPGLPASTEGGALAAALDSAFPGLSIQAREVLATFFSSTEVQAGTLVAKEGDHLRELLLVTYGQARLLRAGLELDVIHPGESAGDLSFVTAMPLAVSVIAASTLGLGRLSFERYRVLDASHPEVARELYDALLGGLSRPRRPEEGASVVRERSLPRRGQVAVLIQGVRRSVPVGTRARHVLPHRIKERLVVAALLDRKAVSLLTPITSDCEVTALTTAHWEGQRLYRLSLGLVALAAAGRLSPPATLELGPSLGFAQRIAVPDSGGRDMPLLARELAETMKGLASERVPLLEEWWAVDEAREHLEKVGSPAASLLRTSRDRLVRLVRCGTVYALSIDPLLPDAGELEAFHVLPDEGALLLAYGPEAAARPLASSAFPAVPEALVPAGVVGTEGSVADLEEEDELAYLGRHARRASAHAGSLILGPSRWLRALSVGSVGALNDACIDGNVAQLIRVSEGFQEKRIGAIADEVRDRIGDIRVVCIAGPSSSGKSTFIRRLEVQLQVNGIKPIGLSLDDYYVDRERTPKDSSGIADYEALGALQLDLLCDQLSRLLDGEEVATARFDFATGQSHPRGGRVILLEESHVLLLEGIHGLNPALLATVPASNVFRVFCCPLAQLPFDALTRVHASDVRLLRRIVRDRHSRGANAAATIDRWPSVRAGERRHIFPFQHHADAVFDSSLIYELNVLRVFAERYLLEVPSSAPAHTTAHRLIRLLDRFVAIYPDHVPPTSILREFIGGSGFSY